MTHPRLLILCPKDVFRKDFRKDEMPSIFSLCRLKKDENVKKGVFNQTSHPATLILYNSQYVQWLVNKLTLESK